MSKDTGYPRERIEQAARIYSSTGAAAAVTVERRLRSRSASS